MSQDDTDDVSLQVQQPIIQDRTISDCVVSLLKNRRAGKSVFDTAQQTVASQLERKTDDASRMTHS